MTSIACPGKWIARGNAQRKPCYLWPNAQNTEEYSSIQSGRLQPVPLHPDGDRHHPVIAYHPYLGPSYLITTAGCHCHQLPTSTAVRIYHQPGTNWRSQDILSLYHVPAAKAIIPCSESTTPRLSALQSLRFLGTLAPMHFNGSALRGTACKASWQIDKAIASGK